MVMFEYNIPAGQVSYVRLSPDLAGSRPDPDLVHSVGSGIRDRHPAKLRRYPGTPPRHTHTNTTLPAQLPGFRAPVPARMSGFRAPVPARMSGFRAPVPARTSGFWAPCPT